MWAVSMVMKVAAIIITIMNMTDEEERKEELMKEN